LETLINDPDLQDILVLNLSRAVQLCVDAGTHIVAASGEPSPGTMGEVFDSLERLGAISESSRQTMRKAVGFRNIAVHNYHAMNWAIVFSICETFLPDFRSYMREILDFRSRA
jgi:uncharacterized protein YutE (UPF0331/DUF86 family)